MDSIDSKVLAGFIDGHKDAFHIIYEKSFAFIYNTTNKLVRNAHEAEDLTHDIYVKIYDKRSTFDPSGNFKTWMYRIAVNHSLNHIKRKNTFYSKIANFFLGEYNKDHDHSRKIEEEEDVVFVRKLLGRLKDSYRIPLILKDIENLTYNEICEILDMNLSTVKTNVTRARKQLVELYFKEDES